MTAKVEIYTSPFCGYCARAKALLTRKGVDYTEFDVLADSTLRVEMTARAEGRTIQRLGRLMRPHAGKGTPVLYDLVDEHPLARRQHSARLRAYRKVLGEAATLSTTSWEVS